MSQTADQIVEVISAALDDAIELVEDEEGWKMEKEKVWLCTTTVDVAPEQSTGRQTKPC